MLSVSGRQFRQRSFEVSALFEPIMAEVTNGFAVMFYRLVGIKNSSPAIAEGYTEATARGTRKGSDFNCVQLR
jgi:hypothetical protein